MHRSPRRRCALALAATALVIPQLSGVAAAGAPSSFTAPAEAMPEELDLDDLSGERRDVGDVVPFPDVPGVELVALGDLGDPVDQRALDELGRPLPEDPQERVAAIADRLEVAPPMLERLTEIHAVLAEAVTTLDPLVEQRAAAFRVAQERAADATHRASAAEHRARTRTRALTDHRTRMAEVAVEAYVNPPGADVLASVFGGAATTNEDLTAGVLLTAKAENDGVVRDGLQVSVAVAGERLVHDLRVAEAATERANAARVAHDEARSRRDAHRRALDQVAATLAFVDGQITTLREDLETTIESTWGAIEDLAGIPVHDVPVVSVDGIRVHAAIAARLEALLAAAHADGVPLDGWGHRSVQQQINLRRQHCGPTPEDIYLKPASACSPPTAVPGSSMHERGLAVDFHLAGRSISTHASPGYQWLAANAATFGFKNLPSEPWHWSTTGG